MNYRRGLFRVWLILAFLWVVAVAVVGGTVVYNEFQAVAAIKKDLAAKGPYEILDDEPPKLTDQTRLVPVERNPFLVFDHDPWGALRNTIAIAVLPPLALLSLGAALGWAISGFRGGGA